MPNWIKFMGTAGARFVVSRQLRFSAGTWCHLQGLNILIDPGPGTLSRCFASRPKLDPAKLDALILTHRHLDHSNDANVLIEAMTQGTFNRRGALFLPSDAVYSKEPVVFSYLQQSVERMEILREGGSYRLGDLQLRTPVRNYHPVETYGLIFDLPEIRIAFLSDTKYFEQLMEHYRGTDILVLNVMLFQPPPVKEIQHLDLGSARLLIEAIRPRLAVMTHFGMTMLNNRPHRLAQQLTEETGLPVVAAYDGYTLEIGEVINGGGPHVKGDGS